MFNVIKIWIFLVFVFGLIGCGKIDKNSDLKKIDLISDVGVKSFNVEVADDSQEQSKGLMYREQLPKDSGMLFVYPKENYQSFWMKNTKIPLDLLYFDGRGEMVDYKDDFMPCLENTICENYTSKAKVKYVLEVNSDVLDEKGYYKLEIEN